MHTTKLPLHRPSLALPAQWRLEEPSMLPMIPMATTHTCETPVLCSLDSEDCLPSTYNRGYKFYPFTQDQGFNPQTCASACTAQSEYNQQHPAADGTYQICAFFNAYVLSDNGVPQGLYCSLYNETWGPSYATNYGQYRDSDHYTVSDSYSYTLE